MKTVYSTLAIIAFVLVASSSAQNAGPAMAMAPSPYTAATGGTYRNGVLAPFDYNYDLPCATQQNANDAMNSYGQAIINNDVYTAAQTTFATWWPLNSGGQTQSGTQTVCTSQAPNLNISTGITSACIQNLPGGSGTNFALIFNTNISCTWIDTADGVNYSVNETVSLASVAYQPPTTSTTASAPPTDSVNMTMPLNYYWTRTPVTSGYFANAPASTSSNPPSTGRRLLAL